MFRSTLHSSTLSLLKILSIPSSSIPLYNQFSSIPKQTHFRSSINLANSTSGYRNQSHFFQSLRQEHSMASQSDPKPKSVHEFVVKDARGNEVDLSIYKGKVLLIVNVASQCGLTNSNYPELTKLYENYKDQGFEVLAFPCNQFGNQEPGDNEQIVEFACTRFKAEFPIFDKVEVKARIEKPFNQTPNPARGSGLY